MIFFFIWGIASPSSGLSDAVLLGVSEGPGFLDCRCNCNCVFESSLGQLEKAFSPIDFRDEGIVTCLSEAQPEKASFPIDVTDEGIVIRISELHLEKALAPIDVTDDGIVIWVSFSLRIFSFIWTIVSPSSGLSNAAFLGIRSNVALKVGTDCRDISCNLAFSAAIS